MFKPVHCEARTVGKGVVDMHLKCRPVTVHNSSCGQVMFLHLSVIPFMGWDGVCMAGGMCGMGVAFMAEGACVAEGMYGKGGMCDGGHVFQTACMAVGMCG